MNDQHQVRADRTDLLLRHYLSNAGMFARQGSDMFEWAARTRQYQGLVSPQFEPFHHDNGDSRWHIIFTGRDEFVGTIALRFYDSQSVVGDIETGRYAYREPARNGWKPQKLGINLHMSGKVAYRGGILVNPDFRKNRTVSLLTTFAMISAIRNQVDWQYGIAFRNIAVGENGRPSPLRYYGYHHVQKTKPITISYAGRPAEPAYLLWSSGPQISEELERRRRLLETSHGKDLRMIARSLEREQAA